MAVNVIIWAVGLLTASMFPEQSEMIHATVSSSLEATLVKQNPEDGAALAQEVARLLRWRGDVRRLARRGDTLSLLYQYHQPPNASRPMPKLLYLRYQGALLALDATLFSDLDDVARYFDPVGFRIEPLMLSAPVPHYAQISDTVQRGRRRRRHRGDDLMAALGAEVVLPFAGTVRRLNWHRRHNGLCVEVILDAGYTAHFLHLLDVSPELKVGMHLPAGTRLGSVGNTGHSFGPHLHYELLLRQNPVEPMRVHGHTFARLKDMQMDAFVRLRLRCLARLGQSRVAEQKSTP